MPIKKLDPIHPGEVLIEEFLKPLSITQYRIAKDISVPPRRINEIVHGTRSISVDTAFRLGKYFGNSPEFWLNLQMKYDIESQQADLEKRIRIEVIALKDTKLHPKKS